MNSLKDLEDRKDEISLTLDRIEQIYKTYDKKYDKKKENEMKKVHKLMDDIKTNLLVANRVEKQISGPKTVEASRTKDKIKKFEETLKEFQNNLKKDSIYYYDTGPEASFASIEKINKNIEAHKETLNQFRYYEDMFKFQERESLGCQKILETVETEVGWMKKLWEHINKCQ